MTTVLPTHEEVLQLVPRRGDAVWRLAGDVRLLSAAGYALMLQVAHPTVGAGVGEHSSFAADPWGRLLRTLDYVNGTVYGGPHLAGAIGRRVRAMHTQIKGLRPDGTRYHALEPGAYAWVHATLASAIIESHRHFGRRLHPGEAEEFWAGWRRLGRLIGVRDRDLPEEWAAFPAYFDSVVEHDLADNPTVHEVLETLARPPRPPVGALPPAAWNALSRPLTGQMHTITVGLLPPRLRERLGIAWSGRQQRAFRALCAASRAGTPLVRGPLRDFGQTYVAWRRTALARGDVARTPVEVSA